MTEKFAHETGQIRTFAGGWPRRSRVSGAHWRLRVEQNLPGISVAARQISPVHCVWAAADAGLREGTGQ